jgi:predicted  nucleic acid-binding Zn-ribbon protein
MDLASPKEIWDKAYEIANLLNKVNALTDEVGRLADVVSALNERVVRLEASLDTAKAEIKLEAIREAQTIVNSVQSGLYAELMKISRAIDPPDRLENKGRRKRDE